VSFTVQAHADTHIHHRYDFLKWFFFFKLPDYKDTILSSVLSNFEGLEHRYTDEILQFLANVIARFKIFKQTILMYL
jgi:hypothetical protein